MERPKFIKNEYLEFLDDLRKSGIVNMMGARPYLMNAFDSLTEERAGRILVYWIKTFNPFAER